MNTQEINALLALYNNQITSKIIETLITDEIQNKNRLMRLYRSYKGDVEIKNRVFEDATKINSKLNNDYRGDIVDGITGYMFGEAISYVVDSSKYNESEIKKIEDTLNSFSITNNIEDLDSTTGEMMSICGVAARLLYIGKDGKEKVMNINPWEVIFVMDATLDVVQYALIYYPIEFVENGTRKTRTRVEWYDDDKVSYFLENDSGHYDLEQTEGRKNPQPHMFDGIPVIRFINNNLLQSDFEKVEALIDAYDRSLSDIQNEVEEFRLAYFAYYGVEPTPEIIKAARQTGALMFPVDTSGAFITKDLSGAVEFMKDHKKTVNENIYKFAKAVDMRDEQFSGSAMSGESRKWKLVALENRAKTKERKFVKALREQFRILCTAWNVKAIKLDYTDITFQFKRNLPVDLSYIADVLSKLNGQISDETRLSLAPFIKDVNKEMEKIKAEQETQVDFNNVPLDKNQDPQQ